MSDEAGLYYTLRTAIRNEEPIALATVIGGPAIDADGAGTDGVETGKKLLVSPDGSTLGDLGNEDLNRVVIRDSIGELSAGTSGVRHYGPRGQARQDGLDIFIEAFARPPQMLIFGAVDFTAALCRVAKVLGYRVTVCDARPVFATKQRFPYADEVVVDWPNRLLDRVGSDLGLRDAICVLTHDPKFDVPAVQTALQTNAGYIGAMGSRRTTEDRNARLVEVGVDPADLSRVMAPIGLDIGGRTPEETAISVCAEIIALHSGRIAPSLRDAEGDIHRSTS